MSLSKPKFKASQGQLAWTLMQFCESELHFCGFRKNSNKEKGEREQRRQSHGEHVYMNLLYNHPTQMHDSNHEGIYNEEIICLAFIFSVKSFILISATSSVCWLIFAKHTLNQPASKQWHDEPGDTLSLASCSIEFQRLSSPSTVGSSSNSPRFIQQNRPAFPCKHLIPALLSPSTTNSYLFLSLSRFVLR